MNTWRTLLKLTNTKNLTTKYQRINTQPMKTKTIKYTHRIRYIMSTWRTLIELKNTKNRTWQSTKQTRALLKNWMALLWRSTKQTWTLLKLKSTKTDHDRTQNRHEHYRKIEQHFFGDAENRHEHYWKTEYDGTQNRTQLHFGETSNEHIQIKQTSKLPTKKVNENIQSTSNKYASFIPVRT